jgi:tRNA threonylcarbamoyladenosine biosynthesis protein TsaE
MDFLLECGEIVKGVLIVHEPNDSAIFELPDESATQRLGGILAPLLRPGMVVFLEGDLGAGKTSFARSVIHARGHRGSVKSPTYSLVEVYVVSSLYLYHFDFYRFEAQEEFLDAGFDEYFNAHAICLVEWPERAAGCLPAPDLRLRLHHARLGRRVEALANSSTGVQCLKLLSTTWAGGTSCATPARH